MVLPMLPVDKFGGLLMMYVGRPCARLIWPNRVLTAFLSGKPSEVLLPLL